MKKRGRWRIGFWVMSHPPGNLLPFFDPVLRPENLRHRDHHLMYSHPRADFYLLLSGVKMLYKYSLLIAAFFAYNIGV